MPSPNGLAQDGTSARYLPVATSLGFSSTSRAHLRRSSAMAREKPTIWECGHHYPMEVTSVGSAEGGVSEDMSEGVKMIQQQQQQQQQVVEEIGVRGEEP